MRLRCRPGGTVGRGYFSPCGQGRGPPATGAGQGCGVFCFVLFFIFNKGGGGDRLHLITCAYIFLFGSSSSGLEISIGFRI